MNEIAFEILNIIENNNFEAYIVGGFARDSYLNRICCDIDICTNAKGDYLKKLFPNLKNNGFNSYILLFKGYEFEITTFRKEGRYINNRFPQKVKYTKKLSTDLKRRDFTINTLCIDKNHNYVDLRGSREDLDNKVIRLVGSKKSLKQDALRTLRAIRFATVLNFKFDEELESAVLKYGNLVENISYDRRKEELDKIFESSNVEYGLELIRKFNLPLDINVNNVVITDKLGIWAQVLINDKYSFKKDEQKKIELIQKLLMRDFDLYDLYLYGVDIFKIVNAIKNENINILKLYKNLPIKDRSEINITFFEISNTVFTTNKNIGIIYEEIEKQIVYKKVKNDKNYILKYLNDKYKCAS